MTTPKVERTMCYHNPRQWVITYASYLSGTSINNNKLQALEVVCNICKADFWVPVSVDTLALSK